MNGIRGATQFENAGRPTVERLAGQLQAGIHWLHDPLGERLALPS
jgi:hypothetical protein